MVTLKEIAAETPHVEQQGSIWVLRWHQYQFCATVQNDGSIGQFTSGFECADVEQHLSSTAALLMSKADRAALGQHF